MLQRRDTLTLPTLNGIHMFRYGLSWHTPFVVISKDINNINLDPQHMRLRKWVANQFRGKGPQWSTNVFVPCRNYDSLNGRVIALICVRIELLPGYGT